MYTPEHIKPWTHPDNYAGPGWPGYYSAGVGQSRDSDALERSNFAVALRTLGGESETVRVVRESHWAVGWVEWIAIHRDDEAALRIADGLAERLANYPILSEDDFSEREQQDADETWSNCYSPAGRVEYIRDHRDQFDFQDFGDLLGCVRGRYFAGWPSDLLY